MPAQNKPRVVEHYKEWRAPAHYALAVRQVLATLPDSLLKGLEVVILRDASSVTRAEKRKGLADDVLGAYIRPKRRGPGKIHLVLDRILEPWPWWTHKIPIFRHEIVHRILFHELAHHAQELKHPGEPHDEAKVRRAGIKMQGRSLRARHPMFRLVFRSTYGMLDPLVRPWIIRSSPWEERDRQRWVRRWKIRWLAVVALGIGTTFLGSRLTLPTPRNVLVVGGLAAVVLGLYGTISLPLGWWLQSRPDDASQGSREQE